MATLNADLSDHSDVPKAASAKLRSNGGLSFAGFQLYGAGFILPAETALAHLDRHPGDAEVLRPYRNGRDLTGRPRYAYVIDFGFRSEAEARAFPVLFDIVRDRVKPDRDANARTQIANSWWQFGWPRRELRESTLALRRFIVTPETAKHRFFVFFEQVYAPDNMLICITIEDSYALGVLSSAIHVEWALAAGGTLEDRPRYNKTLCFDPFPFPDSPRGLRDEIGRVAERLDQHRKDAIARDERVTMTGMYNVVEKLRSGEKLTDKERAVHEIAACGMLRDLHDELDALVARAYGWPWPMERDEVLERLVALHDERVEEEKHGTVRWLRPEYQVPRFGGAAAAPAPMLDLPEEAVAPAPAEQARPWPAGAVEQIGAVKARVAGAPATPAEVAAAFTRAPAPLVARHLETLALVGEVRQLPDGRYEAIVEPL